MTPSVWVTVAANRDRKALRCHCKNQIIYAHCVAMTKPFGADGAVSPYRIRSHSEDRKGAAIQSLLPTT
ncbi:MAG: hypothetical protein DCC67_05465 [Planctomycetota bacterium]|nr:MAG: hypothetical protein DCC67_05465 [Planctomycetota bacterium]